MQRHRRIVAMVVTAAALVPIAPPTPARAATASAIAAKFTGSGQYGPGMSFVHGFGSVNMWGVMEGTFIAADDTTTVTEAGALDCTSGGQYEGTTLWDQSRFFGIRCYGVGVLAAEVVEVDCFFSAYVRVGQVMTVAGGLCFLRVGPVEAPLELELQLRVVPHTTAPPTTAFSLEGVAHDPS